ncbi:MAG: DUF4468 domain-containing protein [Prolixibacteraceae bacterium]
MKSIILISLILFSFATNGQSVKFPIDETTGKITYSEVVTLNDSISKDELFSRAKICYSRIFNNAKNVIQNQDKDAGIIIGKGCFDVYARALGMNNPGGVINFTLTVSVKNGKYRYLIDNLNHDATGTSMPSGGDLERGKPKQWMPKQWENVLTLTQTKIKELISSLKSEMSKPTPKSENW